MLVNDLKQRVICCSILSLFSSPCLASAGNFYLGTSIASSFAKPDGSAPISYFKNNIITDTFPLNSNGNHSPTLSFNGGYEFIAADKQQTIALGLGAYHTLSPYSYKGQVVESISNGVNNTLSNYEYQTISSRIMAEIQLNWVIRRVIPFVNFGVGPSWNRLYGYNELAITGNGSGLPPFQPMTNKHFSYQAGLGLGTSFNWGTPRSRAEQERISIGYRFVNLGSTTFGIRSPDYPYPLNTRTLKANDIYLSYTHLFR